MPLPLVKTPTFSLQLSEQLTGLVVEINALASAVENRLSDLESRLETPKATAKAPVAHEATGATSSTPKK